MQVEGIALLKGHTLTAVERVGDEAIIFTLNDGRRYQLHHWQSCCETVEIDDIIGDLTDLIGSPILTAEEVSGELEPPKDEAYSPESYTWTFYKLATIKGNVTIRWYGTSNGYYSESVDFGEVGNDN